MVKRTFRSEDEVARALATLNRLSTLDNEDLTNRLQRGDLRALDAQAVASGVLASQPLPKEVETDPPIDPENLEAAIGAIIILPAPQ